MFDPDLPLTQFCSCIPKYNLNSNLPYPPTVWSKSLTIHSYSLVLIPMIPSYSLVQISHHTFIQFGPNLSAYTCAIWSKYPIIHSYIFILVSHIHSCNLIIISHYTFIQFGLYPHMHSYNLFLMFHLMLIRFDPGLPLYVYTV